MLADFASKVSLFSHYHPTNIAVRDLKNPLTEGFHPEASKCDITSESAVKYETSITELLPIYKYTHTDD